MSQGDISNQARKSFSKLAGLPLQSQVCVAYVTAWLLLEVDGRVQRLRDLVADHVSESLVCFEGLLVQHQRWRMPAFFAVLALFVRSCLFNVIIHSSCASSRPRAKRRIVFLA